MVEIEMNKNESGQEFDNAFQLFLNAFLEIHPKKSWPSWFRTHTTYGGHSEGAGRWRFSFTAVPTSALRPGDLWEETKNGRYILARIDPETKEKRYVISNVLDDVITIFEAIVDVAVGNISIVVDRELTGVNQEDLLPLRR